MTSYSHLVMAHVKQAFQTISLANKVFNSLLLVLSVMTVGCGKSSVSQLRTSSPDEAAGQALKFYDTNSDGKLSADELKQSPSLAAAKNRLDTNRDGELDESELSARFAQHDNMSDIVTFSIQITDKNAPVAGAKVVFDPEPFMGEGKQSYEGTSAELGECYVLGNEVNIPGLPTGFYTVHITDPLDSSEHTFGCEVADDLPTANRLEFNLASVSK